MEQLNTLSRWAWDYLNRERLSPFPRISYTDCAKSFVSIISLRSLFNFFFFRKKKKLRDSLKNDNNDEEEEKILSSSC